MARIKVAPKQTFASIAKARNIPAEDLMKANPGVKTLSTGQVIKAPNKSNDALRDSASNQDRGRRGNNGTQGGMGVVFGAGAQTGSAVQGAANFAVSAAQHAFDPTYTAGDRRRRQASPTPSSNKPGGLPSLIPVKQGFGEFGSGAMQLPNFFQQFITPLQPPQQAGQFNIPDNAIQPNTRAAFPFIQPPTRATPNAGYEGTAGYGGTYNQQQRNQQAPFQTPSTNGFTTQPPYLGASSYLNPALIPPQQNAPQGDYVNQPPGYPAPPSNFPQRPPAGSVYTGNPDDPNTPLWKAYWNATATLGYDPNVTPVAPKVMSRSEIWNMKAAQRRKQTNEPDAYQYQPETGQTTPYLEQNGELFRTITWGGF